RARNVVQQPLQLGAREIRVEHQPRFLSDARLLAGIFELRAARRSPTVLPDDGAVNGSAGIARPQSGRLALVGDADRRHFGGFDPRASDGPADALLHRAPDFSEIVLDPSWPGVVLPKFTVGGAHHAKAGVDHQHVSAGGSLVDRDYVSLLGHDLSSAS